MYGATEATARMAYLPVDRVLDAPQAFGMPIPGGRFTIDDDSELIYYGPNVMLGYASLPGTSPWAAPSITCAPVTWPVAALMVCTRSSDDAADSSNSSASASTLTSSSMDCA
jgi:hypothetical protein